MLSGILYEEVPGMVLDAVLERFAARAPIGVMFRGTLENVLKAEDIDRLFLQRAHVGYKRKLLFSQMVDLMGVVVARIQPQIHAAFQENKESIQAGIDCVYDKLQRIEPQVSAGLVQHVAARLAEIIDQMPGSRLPPIFPGYRTRILDGKHLDGTERRLKELRRFCAVPLPGQLLVVLDAERMLACDVIPCEDAHAQERALLEKVLPTVQPGDVWIEDRNFCTTRFVFGVARRGGCFVVRRHASTLMVQRRTRWRKAGQTARGDSVCEATWWLGDGQGQELEVRAVRIRLAKPTRFGEKEIVLLTNLPTEVSAVEVAAGYARRWTLEAAFGEISATLQAEINTMGYPKAALFGFCVGLVAYNALSAIKAALRAAHGTEKVQTKVSAYFLANEVRRTWEGLDIATPDQDWIASFASLPPNEFAPWLLAMAHRVKLIKYPKSQRGPKKKVIKMPAGRHRHISTARILANRTSNSITIPNRC
jgi:IS4 transposase